MATIVLQAAGAFLGGYLGAAGAAIGSAAGAIAGYMVDRALLDSTVRREGPRLAGTQPFTAEEGAALPRVYGTARVAGTLIWATRYTETARTERQGAKGGPKVTTYSYRANAAFALCEGPISHVRRVWADGRELDLTTIEMRVLHGREDQLPDPLIEAVQGTGRTPAYRGTAVVVIDDFPIEDFGNRLPQFQFEVVRTVGALNERVRAVCLIPGSTEHGLATTPVTRAISPGVTETANRHVLFAGTDIAASLDELQALCPALEHVAIVVAWFGNDLRAGDCTIRPKVTVEGATGFSQPWLVSGMAREGAAAVSQTGGGAAYGGTPSDMSVIEAIAEIRSRGLSVTLYPFVMMDVPAGNDLPNPYGGTGQPAYPWRGRITCDPAPGEAGTADKTISARGQVEAFSGMAGPGDFAPAGGTVAFAGGEDWGYRRLVLHYAHLAQMAGGVDAFLVGSELRGLTTLRDGEGAFPFVETLRELAGEAKAVLGGGTKISYGADWSEYFGHQPADGSGDVLYHLDSLWADPAIDAVGIDNYMPLSDWRDEDYRGGNPDGFDGPYDVGGLKAQIAGGEGFDWYYAGAGDRRGRVRTPIADGAYGRDWVFRTKDLVSWWSNEHHDRIGGLESSTPTGWVPASKPIWLTELGCPAIDKGPNQPNVFLDPKSSESFAPHFSNGGRSDLAAMRCIEAHQRHWDPSLPGFDNAANPVSPVYGGRMVDVSRVYLWAWDARPYPAFPLRSDVWGDGDNWLYGHWLNGRLGKVALGDLIEALLAYHGLSAVDARRADGTLHGLVVAGQTTARAVLEPLVDLFGLSVDDSDGLVFATSGRGHAAPPTLSALVLPGDDGQVTARSRATAQTLPAELSLAYRDPLRDYQQAAVRAFDPTGVGAGAETLEPGLVLEAGEAEALAAERLRRRAAERDTVEFALPAQDRRGAIGQLVRFARPDMPGDWLVTAVEEGLVRRVAARRHDRQAPLPMRVVLPVPAGGYRDAGAGEAVATFLDLPMAPGGGEPADRFRVAAFRRPWLAQQIGVSPQETGFEPRALVSLPAVMGELAAPLPAGREGLVDRSGSIDVLLYGGELASVSALQMLNGLNAAAIGSADEVWEIVQFQQAEEVEPSRWRLTGLLRGQLGTDDAMRAGAAAGARFVLLDAAVTAAGLRTVETGLELTWRVAPAGRPLSSTDAQTFTLAGGLRALTPLSPVHVRARMTPAGDVDVTWIRRGRIDADAWLAPEIPLGETAEVYRVEVSAEGGPAVRTVEVAAPSWTYPAALRAGDFPVMPDALDFTIRQMGAGGPGVGRTITFRF
ncbi:MAG: glycoside hydrolase/phage tail family protein [Rhizobiaceae bacterium]|nr:glycoside hydrolase/phage tail family protein [Rhizobiaceae bacterium]MCV0405474.1 glycoside hydrolase/phage tail family protein [Rhizobiaceae bacterium]